jgi:exopolysaccharide production protein ExoZ
VGLHRCRHRFVVQRSFEVADGRNQRRRYGLREIYSIQYLRGFAAVAVVLYHMSERYSGPFKIGAAGVDIFFVISGFIMWVTTAGGNWTPQQFMRRRVIRIIPLYWIVTGVTAVAIMLKPQFLYGHELSTARFIQSLFFVPPTRNGVFFPVVIQGWTLVYEMFFYAVFATALIVPQSWRLWVVGALLSLFALLQPALPEGLLGTLADPIILEFVGGMAIGRLSMSDSGPSLSVGILLLISGLVLFSTMGNFAPQLPRIARWGVPAVLVVAGSVFAEQAASPTRPIYLLKILGDASYSVYLWHVVVSAVVGGVLLHLAPPLALEITLVCALTIGSTVILYFIVERPIGESLRLWATSAGQSKKPEPKEAG